MSKEYTVSEEQKKQFASAYLLNAIVNDDVSIPLYLDEKNNDLEPVLEYMMMKKYISVENKETYTSTQKGRDVLTNFMKRYVEFLKIFDIYCAVDLEQGNFAFEEYFFFETDDEWGNYLNNERWEDLRVAVAVFKKINPVEIVFMSFLKEGQFGDRGEGWQFDLLLGTIWDDILDVCKTAVTATDISYTDEDGSPIDGNAVLEDVIVQGAELNLELHKEEKKRIEQQRAEEKEYEDDIDEYEPEYEVYEHYCQPMYISPVWLLILFI